jgi:hypothetical protein
MQVCFLDKLEDRIRDFPSQYLGAHDVTLSDGDPSSVPQGTQALITWSDLLDESLVGRLSELKLVQRIG